MLASKKTLSLLLLALHLTACGGGGGGGGSPAPVAPPVTESSDEPAVPQLPDDSSESETEEEETTPVPSVTSKAEADSYYLGLASSSYDGNESDAELNETSALQVTDFFFSDLLGDTTTGPSSSSAEKNQSELVEQASIILANQQISSQLNKPSEQFKISALTIQVDNVENCDSGTRHYRGEEDENGIGLLEVTYRNCRFGDLTFTGKGHFTYHSSDLDQYTNFYDGVTVYTPSGNYIWTGSIETSLNTDVISELHNIRQLSLHDLSDLKYSNYRITRYTGLGYSEWSGDVYFDDLGKVSINARNMIRDGEAYISGVMEMTSTQVLAQVYVYSEAYTVVSLDSNNDGVFDKSVLLSDDMDFADVDNSQFVSPDEIVVPGLFTTSEEADNYYLTLADNLYLGLRTAASVNEQSALEWFRAMVGSSVEGENTQLKPSSVNASEQALEFDTSSLGKLRFNLSQYLVSQSNTSSIVTVNDLIPCDEGNRRYQGQLENGVGILNVTYNGCVLNGVTYSGKGHHLPGLSRHTNYFDEVQVVASQNTYALSGVVQFDEAAFNFLGNTDTQTQNITIQVQGSDFIEHHKNFKIGLIADAYEDDVLNLSEVLFISGDIYFSDQGYVSVSSEDLDFNGLGKPLSGSVSILNGQDQIATLEFFAGGYALVSIDPDSDGNYQSAALLPSGINLTDQEILEIEFVDPDTINAPPVASRPEIVAYSALDTRNPLLVDFTMISDREGDSISYPEYRWYINDELSLEAKHHYLPAHVAVFGDEVSVEVLISDGHHQVWSERSSVVMKDAPAELKVNGITSRAVSGETVSFLARIVDPDDGSFTAATLMSKPQGATIDESGVVSWVAPEPESAGISKHTFQFANPRYSSNPRLVEVLVQSSSKAEAIAYAGMVSPNKNSSIHVGNFDEEAGNEILTTDSKNRIMLVEYNGIDYRQKWLYPYPLPRSNNNYTEVVQVVGYDVEGGEELEIFAATNHGVFYIKDKQELAETIAVYDDVVRSIAIGQLDGISGPSLVVSFDQKIEIIDLATRSVVHVIPILHAFDIALRNVDDDIAMEIITSVGDIYDGATFKRQWSFGPHVISQFAVGDVDADGIDEVFAVDNFDGGRYLYDLQGKDLSWEDASADYCYDVIIENIDQDPQEEIIVLCFGSYVTVYDAISGVPEPQGQWSGAKIALAVGDSDNDGEVEIHWAGESVNNELQIVNGIDKVSYSPGYDSSFAAGWSNVSGSEKAVFIANSSSFFDFSEAILFDASGQFTSTQFSSSDEDPFSSGLVLDYDKNGTDELFLGSSSLAYDAVLLALNLDDYSELWSFGRRPVGSGLPDEEFTYIDSMELNADDIEDLVYVDNNGVGVFDVHNDVLISSGLTMSYPILDVLIADFNGDGKDDIAATDSAEIRVWIQTNSDFDLFLANEASCSKLEAVQLDEDEAQELICLKLEYGTQKELLTFDVLPDELNLVASFDSPFFSEVEEIVSDPEDSSAVYVAFDSGNNQNRLIKLSVLTWETLWHGPDILGEVTKDGWRVRSEAEANGGSRMAIGTSDAMYLLP